MKDIMRQMIAKDVSMQDVAKALNVSRAAVCNTLHEKRKCNDMIEKIKDYVESVDTKSSKSDFEISVRLKLIDKDMSVSDLAKELNVSRQYIYKALSDDNYVTARKRINEIL